MHREGDERVTPLELFFDLVFVLCITQCTAFMAHDPSWGGLLRGLVILAALWWAWVGYSWVTSVVDPEEGVVRGAMFGAMAGLMVAALCVPEAFGEEGLTFAVAYGVVRVGQLVLLWIAGDQQPALRRSVITALVPSTLVGVTLIAVASQTEGDLRLGLWIASVALDMLGPYVAGSGGWQLVPHHFAERHGLIFLIALGESIVAIGVGAEGGVDGGVIAASVAGAALAAAMWWAYFDVVAKVAERRLAAAAVGREQNEMARDAFSFLHYPMVAGVVLVALGLKKTLAHVDEPLGLVPTAALVGGVGIYLLSHVAVRLRTVGTLNRQRLLLGVVLLVVVPAVDGVDALVVLIGVAALLWAMVGYEATRFAEARDAVRHRGDDVPPS